MRIVVAVLVAAGTFLVLQSPAAAPPNIICETYNAIDPETGRAVVRVRCSGADPGNAPDVAPCVLYDVTDEPFLDGLDPPPEGYIVVQWFCDGTAASWPFIMEAGDPVDPVAVAQEIAASIQPVPPTLDQIATSPESRGEAFSIVQVDTWFWLTDDYWQARTGSRDEGGLSISVTASPTSGEWVTGDGGTVSCNYQGDAWSPGSTTRFFHEFTSSSADESGEAYGASVAVTWVYTWTLNGAPQGELGTFTTAATDFPIVVGEIQAVESNGAAG